MLVSIHSPCSQRHSAGRAPYVTPVRAVESREHKKDRESQLSACRLSARTTPWHIRPCTAAFLCNAQTRKAPSLLGHCLEIPKIPAVLGRNLAHECSASRCCLTSAFAAWLLLDLLLPSIQVTALCCLCTCLRRPLLRTLLWSSHTTAATSQCQWLWWHQCVPQLPLPFSHPALQTHPWSGAGSPTPSGSCFPLPQHSSTVSRGHPSLLGTDMGAKQTEDAEADGTCCCPTHQDWL